MRLFCRFAIIQFETKFLPRPGSARLALPAEARALRARRLRRPARRARGLKGVWLWIDAGALPLHPVGGHVPRTPV